MKRIRITFSNGDCWSIPAAIVAEAYGTHFAEIDPTTTYEEEFRYCLGDNGELIDWLCNNMDWTDVKEYAEYGPVVGLDYDKEFCNAGKEIVEE